MHLQGTRGRGRWKMEAGGVYKVEDDVGAENRGKDAVILVCSRPHPVFFVLSGITPLSFSDHA